MNLFTLMAMKTPPKKIKGKLVSTRIPSDLYERLMRRVSRSGKLSGVPTNLGAVVRALLEEHA